MILGTGIASGLAPYVARYITFKNIRINSALDGIDSQRLLLCAIIFAIVSSTLHQLWFFANGSSNASLNAWVVMMIGDFWGTVLVLYLIKATIKMMRHLAKNE
jgi:hypothetical protein